MRVVLTLTMFAISIASAGARAQSAETPWSRISSAFEVPDVYRDDFGSWASVLSFTDGRRVQSAEDWTVRRSEILQQWTDLLGTWPPLITEPQVEVLETIRRDTITQKRIRFRWTPTEFTTGYLLIPDGTEERPAVLTVYYEPETAVGARGELRDFAWRLAQRGFVTLSIGTTEASEAHTYALYYPSINDANVQPLSMLACAAANAWHVLAAQPEVDADRIGIVGHSFGGKWAMFAGCLFDRFAAVAVSDPGIMFGDHPSVNYWEPWYLGWHPQPWRKRGPITADNPARGLYPKLLQQGHDLHELQALLAPRPFLVSGGEVDPPDRWRALNHLVRLNSLLGKTHRVGMTNRPQHAPTPESNSVIDDFFVHFLQPPPGQEFTTQEAARTQN
ncbi:MAG: sialidase [Planctomycetaceae bacterium]